MCIRDRFYDNDFEHAYLVCSATLDYIPKVFPPNQKIGTKLNFKKSYPKYIHEAVEQKKIIYIEAVSYTHLDVYKRQVHHLRI